MAGGRGGQSVGLRTAPGRRGGGGHGGPGLLPRRGAGGIEGQRVGGGGGGGEDGVGLFEAFGLTLVDQELDDGVPHALAVRLDRRVIDPERIEQLVGVLGGEEDGRGREIGLVVQADGTVDHVAGPRQGDVHGGVHVEVGGHWRGPRRARPDEDEREMLGSELVGGLVSAPECDSAGTGWSGGFGRGSVEGREGTPPGPDGASGYRIGRPPAAWHALSVEQGAGRFSDSNGSCPHGCPDLVGIGALEHGGCGHGEELRRVRHARCWSRAYSMGTADQTRAVLLPGAVQLRRASPARLADRDAREYDGRVRGFNG
nr:hypothetical protein CFP56_20992 [Quercus suber]